MHAFITFFLLLQGGDVCCINVKILDYYLRHILDSQVHEGGEHHYPRLHLVRPDLNRVAKDLEPHCVSSASYTVRHIAYSTYPNNTHRLLSYRYTQCIFSLFFSRTPSRLTWSTWKLSHRTLKEPEKCTRYDGLKFAKDCKYLKHLINI